MLYPPLCLLVHGPDQLALSLADHLNRCRVVEGQQPIDGEGNEGMGERQGIRLGSPCAVLPDRLQQGLHCLVILADKGRFSISHA